MQWSASATVPRLTANGGAAEIALQSSRDRLRIGSGTRGCANTPGIPDRTPWVSTMQGFDHSLTFRVRKSHPESRFLAVSPIFEGDEMQPNAKDNAPRRHPVGNLFTPIEASDNVTVEQVIQAVQGLEKCQLGRMLALTHLLEHDGGDSTPVEDLISGLLLWYGAFGGCVTLEDVQEKVSNFLDNWRMMIGEAKGAAQRYPHLFSVVESGEADGPADTSTAGAEAEPTESAAAKEDDPKPQAKLAETPDAETSTGQQPETATLRTALGTLDECASTIERQRRSLLRTHKEWPEEFADLFTDALLLREVLRDWDSEAYSDQFPGETRLIAAIRGNLEL